GGARARRAGWHRAGADDRRPGDRLLEGRRPEPRGDTAARRAPRAGPAAAGRALAQGLPRRGAGARRGGRAVGACRRRGRRGRDAGRPHRARPRRRRDEGRRSRGGRDSRGRSVTLLERLQAFLASTEFGWRDALDVLIVAFIIYELLLFIRGTHAVQM